MPQRAISYFADMVVCPLLAATPEGLVEMAEHLNALRAIEALVVVHPAPHHRVGEAS
jgi:hypothetical protein